MDGIPASADTVRLGMYLLLFVLYVCRLEVVIAPAFCRSEFVLLSHVLNVIVVARGPHGMSPEKIEWKLY